MSILKRYSLLFDLYLALRFALWPTVTHIWATPSLLFHPTAISRIFMSNVWTVFGPGIDQNSAQVKTALITQNAYGVVLDIGAGKPSLTCSPSHPFIHFQGHGHTAKYLDRSHVTKYVALEPNVHMHDEIRRAAEAAGFSEAAGTFLLLACSAQDTSAILASLGGHHPVNTLVSVLTLCSVPEPQETIKSLVTEVLRPGGQMLFFEHVRNPQPHIARWQTFWSPLWALAFDGCRLDCPTDKWIHEVGCWASEELTGVDDEDEEHLFWHRIGYFIKAA